MGSPKPKPIVDTSFILFPIQLGLMGYGLTRTIAPTSNASTTRTTSLKSNPSGDCSNSSPGTSCSSFTSSSSRKRESCCISSASAMGSSGSSNNCIRERSSPSLKRKCQFHILSTILTCFILGSFLNCPVGAEAKKILCNHSSEPSDGQDALAEPCESITSNFCFALWKVNNNTGEITFMKQGCWEPSPVNACLQEDCVATKEISDKGFVPDKTHFCCCSTDLCNSNVTATKMLEEEEELDPNRDLFDGIFPAEMNSTQDSLHTPIAALIAVITGISVALAIFVGVFITWKNKAEKHKPSNVDDLESGEKLMEPLFKEDSWEISDPMVLGDELAKGKFATVCSGKMGGMEVALKVFSADQREFFENEKFIFHCLGKTTSLSYIVKYHGWQEFSVNSSPNLIIALDLIRPGNLRDFLAASETNTMSLSSLMKVMRGICSGLSYLHGENKDEIVIAHRDLTSKNILIDVDLNCYVSDFGLSLLTKGSKYYWSGKERQAEFCSLAEAGTLRYMAPELLEGAVNLKDCENALKQADVYALALILWEVANLSHDIALPSSICHRLPYEKELGKDICIESLARYVVSRRDRPSFSGWRDSSVTRSIRDTLNESWDPEPDARLTALCIVERLADLHHSKNNVGDSTTPLEAPPTSPWAGRNPCLERNLLEENSEDKSTEYLVTSEKHLIPNRPPTTNSRIMQFIPGGGGGGMSVSSSSDQSFSGAATTNTDLSSSSAQTHPLHLPVPPNPIPFVQNIRR